MFSKDLINTSISAKRKVDFLKRNPLGYFLAAILAGIFVGFGVLVSFTLGACVKGTLLEPLEKLLIGLSFSVALSLVVFAGSELFTGNAMVMTLGVLKKEVKLKDSLILLLMSYLGNFIGALLLSLLFILADGMKSPLGNYLLNSAETKQAFGYTAMIFKGILCNMLVCLAVWSSSRTKSDSAKLILIMLCILTFVVAGLEHSIANMTVFLLPLFTNFTTTLLTNSLIALFFVTLGNIIGGVLFVAVPYYLIAKNDTEEQ